MTGPSPHLSWKELACKDGTPYPLKWTMTRAAALAVEFERIRSAVGHPIRVGSAYRTEAHNRAVGGARHSQHVQGRALDLYPPSGWAVERFYRIIRSVVDTETSAVYGVGRYPTFVHVDTRAPAHGRLVVWQGSRAWAEAKHV